MTKILIVLATVLVLVVSAGVILLSTDVITLPQIGRVPEPVVPTPISQPTTFTGLEIAKQTALFLDKSVREDGSVVLGYYCIKQSPHVGFCRPDKPDPSQPYSHAAAQIGEAYYKLYEKTDDSSYKDKALKVAEFALKECQDGNSRTCFRNALAFNFFYKATGDNRYKEAALKASSSEFTDALLGNYTPGWSRNGAYLAMLYELTNDKRYLNQLEKIAAQMLAGGFPQGEDNPIFYQEGDFVVGRYDVQIVWDYYIEAYKVTKKPEYLAAAKEFFKRADIPNHLEDFKNDDNGENLSFTEALLDLVDLLDNPSEKEQYLSYAHLQSQQAYTVLSDNPQNKKFDGDYGFLFLASDGGNSKRTVQSAWRVRQYIKLADKSFAID